MNLLNARVSFLSLTALVVANMVGTGVFTSLGFQLLSLQSGFVLLMLWVVGGLCALCGALCYAELGGALCRNGGEYTFLTRIYAKPVGFLAGWVSITAGFSAPVAIAAMALGAYLHRMNPAIPATGVAVGIIVALTLLHLARLEIGTLFQNIATILKALLALAIVGGAMLHNTPEPISFLPAPGDGPQFTTTAFATSLVFVMYAYSGWNAATYVAAEAKNPARDVPRSLLAGTGFVLLLYVGLNWAFLRTTPADLMRGQAEVGLIAANHMLGPTWGRYVGAGIALLLVSTISSMIRVGPRVAQAMGEDHGALRLFSSTSRHGVPLLAVVFQGTLSLLFVATGTFERVLLYAQFSMLICTFLAALGVVVLRFREPNLPRPYHVWGYPLPPLVFLGITGWMLVFAAKDKPVESALGFGTLLSGLLLYTLMPRVKSLLTSSRAVDK